MVADGLIGLRLSPWRCVMLAFLKNLTIWTAVVSFAAASLVGEGLHLLPGCGHDHGVSSGQCHHGVCTCQSQHRAVGCGVAEQHEEAVGGGFPAGHFTGDEDACPICRFIAQAKAPAANADAAPAAMPVPDEPVSAPVLRVLLFARSFDARGPPLAV